jgi:hypothetical protein
MNRNKWILGYFIQIYADSRLIYYRRPKYPDISQEVPGSEMGRISARY